MPEKSLSIEQPGRYVFVETEAGWDLIAEKQPANSANPNLAPGPVDSVIPRLEAPLAPANEYRSPDSVVEPPAVETLPPPRRSVPRDRNDSGDGQATQGQSQASQRWPTNGRIRAARPGERQSNPATQNQANDQQPRQLLTFPRSGSRQTTDARRQPQPRPQAQGQRQPQSRTQTRGRRFPPLKSDSIPSVLEKKDD